ncbi:MAG: Alanine-tRNA ligase [Candidatus Woesebacteria bacterium GW2011_GWB1_41_10]|uniref:alanine--tRNA ligase n=1 Tax=Candidatus Woesebacteria bacterium GW2011_GWB1_41_10 TaxID=1618577 RepID=A0A0G0XHF2_9BACT|nr:MAG: Alanine-tRNA ligase [Candidatus Woesebacteria bacterium GW2011_GWB1_41_10]
MPAGEIGGPDSEIFYEFDIPHDPAYGAFCHPNCDCGKFLEIGNSVFMQYEKLKSKKLKELPQKNVDFGGGLERIAAAVNNDPDVFHIDLFLGIIKRIEEEVGINYGRNLEKDRSFRIIADHLRASCNLLAEEVFPSNKLHGYALRRLVRRAMFHFHLLGSGISGGAVSHVSEDAEAIRFESALKRGLAKLTKAVSDGIAIDGEFAFDLYQTEGFPLELTMEIMKQNGTIFNLKEKNVFEAEFKKHKSLSRTTSAGIFKGGLAEKGEVVTKFHTVTHLLHAALREVLGEHVSQKGSHITQERLRFDFSYQEKLTEIELEEVEKLINQKVREDLDVSFEEKSLDEAVKEGALHFFGEKYGEKVKVYKIGSFSMEICGGPHVTNTARIGRVKIIKQEKIGLGVIRIYARLSE